MLTYALDEYGDFEGIQNANKPIYIAGLIYDVPSKFDPQEEKNERKRVSAYYKAVIKTAKEELPDGQNASEFTYPEALHSNGDPSRNKNVISRVKKRINASLAEFIQNGTYNGKKLQYTDRNGRTREYSDRKGVYYIFVVLKSDRGMTRLLGENANILAKDDYASNLYFHMANEVISRTIFYNPLISDITEISLDIATRRSAPLKNGDSLFREYKKQGYKAVQVDNENDEFWFKVTNPDIYRTVIAEEILDAEKPNIKINKFNVTSINYHRGQADGMEFLYLADSICSVLGFKIEGDNADVWLSCVDSRVNRLTGKNENLVFGYDEIDNIYAKAWAKYSEGDYYKALSISFDAGKLTGGFAEYYKNTWFKNLEKKITESKNVSDFNMAVRKLNETLNNNTLDPDKCFYILGVLEELVPAMEEGFHSPEAKRILYTLYDIGVTASCHIGDSRRAEEYFEKCKQYVGLASLEDYLGTRNKMVVFCCDYFEMDRAEALSDENIEYQEKITNLKNALNSSGVCDADSAQLGKTYSQRGQVYAFKRDSRAERQFRLALEHFVEGSADYKITQSYLMHYLLDTNSKEAYLTEAEGYFGGRKKLGSQLDYIIDEGSKNDPLINMKYALYIYLRALYCFRLSELTVPIWSKIQKIEKEFEKNTQKQEWKLTGHPSELIFKYMRLIAISRNETKLEEKYAQRMETCLLYRGATEDAILKFGELEILDRKGDIEQRNKISLQLCQELRIKFEVFKNIEIPEDGENRYRWLKEQMTFMYR